MNLAEIMMAFNHKISGGSQYMWNCFGPNAWFLDFENNVSIIIDRMTREVYEVSWYPDTVVAKDDEIYEVTWVNPSYIGAYKEECESRRVRLPEFRDDLVALVKEIAEVEGFNDEIKEFTNEETY